MGFNRVIFLTFIAFFYLAGISALLYLIITKTTNFDILKRFNMKDGFTADRVPSGDFPHEVDEPLLYPIYPKKKSNYGIIFRDNNSENNSKLYPVAGSVSSYDQATNNVREWVTPDNGTCRPASMCGALYDAKEPAEQKVPEPIPFDIPDKRVGYYASTRL